jgi:predicted lipoprotein with Yx(FWY)xxD motif
MRRSPTAIAVAIALVVALGAATAAAALAKGNATVRPRHTSLGTILADAKGRTLYLFTKDKPTASMCSEACASAWPPALAGHHPTVGAGLDTAALGTLKRPDGRVQVTYAGHPLYRFAGDGGRPGSVRGQRVTVAGGTFLVVGTDGKARTRVAAKVAPAPSGH